MSYVTAFVFLLSTLTVGLLASDPVYECASRLNTTDIPGGPFYLRLEAANESTSMPVSNGSCPIDDQRIQDLSCMCGEKLLRQQSEIQALFDESCEFYDEAIVGNASPLGFCERALKGTGRCVTFEPSQGTVSGVNEFTADSLGAKLDEINRILLGFKGVLDRTIVHVYLRSKGHRCQCLVSACFPGRSGRGDSGDWRGVAWYNGCVYHINCQQTMFLRIENVICTTSHSLTHYRSTTSGGFVPASSPLLDLPTHRSQTHQLLQMALDSGPALVSATMYFRPVRTTFPLGFSHAHPMTRAATVSFKSSMAATRLLTAHVRS